MLWSNWIPPSQGDPGPTGAPSSDEVAAGQDYDAGRLSYNDLGARLGQIYGTSITRGDVDNWVTRWRSLVYYGASRAEVGAKVAARYDAAFIFDAKVEKAYAPGVVLLHVWLYRTSDGLGLRDQPITIDWRKPGETTWNRVWEGQTDGSGARDVRIENLPGGDNAFAVEFKGGLGPP